MINDIIKMIELSKNTKGSDWKYNLKQIKLKIKEYAEGYYENKAKNLITIDVDNRMPSVCGLCNKDTVWVHNTITLETTCYYCGTPRPQAN